MQKPKVCSVRTLKSRSFGHFKIKFMETWVNSPVSIVNETMPPDTDVPPVCHQKTDEFVYILSGKAVVCLDGRESCVEKGSYLVIPRGTKHSFRTQRTKMEAISVFSPPMDKDKPDAKIIIKKNTAGRRAG
jgi:mannose-6-phosphate isomerase-like protein (cupin superfamily)